MDEEGIKELASEIAVNDAQVTALQTAIASKLACVATFNNQIVGLVAFLDTVNMADMCENFSVTDVINVGKYRADAYLELDTLVINPIFHTHMRDVLMHAIVLCKKECVFYAVRTGQAASVALEVMQQVRQTLSCLCNMCKHKAVSIGMLCSCALLALSTGHIKQCFIFSRNIG